MLGSEIRVSEITLIGRLQGDPVALANGEVHFRIEAIIDQPAVHCFFPAGKDAEAFVRNKRDQDEVSLEGNLIWRSFANEPKPLLLIQARHASYGRKSRTLHPQAL